jgi:hypothetical protein
MALLRSVIENDILCGLYADICSDVSDDCETEILDIDSYIPITSSHKQSQSCPLVLTSKSETGRVRGRM